MVNKAAFLLLFFFLSLFTPSFIKGETGLLSLIKSIEERMSGIRTLETDFVQEKDLAIFDKKVILKGKIFIQEPDTFIWRSDAPVRYVMVMKKDIVKQWDEDTRRVQEFNLNRSPGLAMAMVQIKAWFYGKFNDLLGDYEVSLLSEDPLMLEFIPKYNSASASMIDKAIITFQPDKRYIKRIDIKEKNQGKTSLVFSNTKINYPISPSNWKLQ